ncbi:MAG: glycosyltransferase, partial [Actinomycetota bacterium]|nr:glycosyltransferase [Actinomycetota bacterium]
MTRSLSFDVVVPTISRPSLATLLAALARCDGPRPERTIVVTSGDDAVPPLAGVSLPLEVLPGPRRGPAAARNAGWRAARAEWVVFLDDDVVPAAGWLRRLASDLAAADEDVAGVQGRVSVPLPSERRPSDWERNVAGLETALWATADMAYRRRVLAEVGGFDERFRRAYREDADLALRVIAAGYGLERGSRRVAHPVPAAERWESLRRQAGNADDALMVKVHGRGWQADGERRGRRSRHVALTTAGVAALAG